MTSNGWPTAYNLSGAGFVFWRKDIPLIVENRKILMQYNPVKTGTCFDIHEPEDLIIAEQLLTVPGHD